MSAPEAWYLLIHQVPATPLYLRARVRQLLSRSGAVPLKKSVYALPKTEAGLKRLKAVAAEIERDGGTAYLCEARFEDPETHAALIESFQQRRTDDYEGLAAEVARAAQKTGALERTRSGRSRSTAARNLARFRSELDRIESIDFLGARGRTSAEQALRAFERAFSRRGGRAGATGSPPSKRGRTWVTRRGVHVDRIACAWFIRRFLDPEARFRFVDAATSGRNPGPTSFDMPGAEFTHEAGRCSVESLVAKSGASDPAVKRIAEIVHDIDLQDGRFTHPETAGVRQLLEGILAGHREDRQRIERGLSFFDDLHRSLAGKPVAAPQRIPTLRPRSIVRTSKT